MARALGSQCGSVCVSSLQWHWQPSMFEARHFLVNCQENWGQWNRFRIKTVSASARFQDWARNVDEWWWMYCTYLYFTFNIFLDTCEAMQHVRPSTLWMHASAVRRCVSCSSSWSRGTTRGSRHLFFVTYLDMITSYSHQIFKMDSEGVLWKKILSHFVKSYHLFSSFSASDMVF